MSNANQDPIELRPVATPARVNLQAPPVVNGNPTANPRASSPQPPLRPPPTAQQNGSRQTSATTSTRQSKVRNQNAQARHNRIRVFTGVLKALGTLLPATIIVFLAAAFALTDGKFEYWPLTKLSPNNGILILSLLSKATDFALAIALATAFERIQLGPLLGEGESLLKYLVLSPSTGVGGWLRILFHRLVGRSGVERSPRGAIAAAAARSWGWRGGLREPFRRWALIRIVLWAVAQFPGIILLSVVDTGASYYPTNMTRITGGLGVFNPNLVASRVQDLLLADSVLHILKDSTSSYPVDSIHAECRKKKCDSYMLCGGIRTVYPSPYLLARDESLDVYMTKHEPTYHVDVWDAPKSGILWDPSVCKVYGDSPDGFISFQLCIDKYQGHIIAGWRPCYSNVNKDGICNREGGWDGTNTTVRTLSTFVAIYRRTASVTSNRATNEIEQVTDIGTPVAQDIAPEDFFTVFNGILSPWSASPSTSVCSTQLLKFKITQYLWERIIEQNQSPATHQAIDILQNLFGTALYLFNPVTAPNAAPYTNQTQPGLPDENQIFGSIGRTRVHAEPKAWTIYAYVAVAGLLVLLAYGVVLWTAPKQMPHSTSFPVVDFLNLRRGRRVIRGTQGPQTVKNLFDDGGSESTSTALRRAETEDVHL